MKNFRINIAESKGKVNHCWIERKRFFMWFSLRYISSFEGDMPSTSLFRFDTPAEAEEYLKKTYKSNYSIEQRRIII